MKLKHQKPFQRSVMIGFASALICAALLAQSAFATFVPEHMIRWDELTVGPAAISEQEFMARVTEVQNSYKGLVQSLGGKLSVKGNWRNDTPNARAAQLFGTWSVEITGGLARRPELTGDALTLILCHEVGHHLGGFPFVNNGPGPIPIGETWAAAEGQADYFSTHVCSRRLWAQDLAENSKFRGMVSPAAKLACDGVWESREDQDLCYRTSVAVTSMIATMASLMGKPMPEFSTPDPTAVDKTFLGHPDPQCRMDTTFQASLCRATWDPLMIPGRGPKGGSNDLRSERESAERTCTKLSGFDGPFPMGAGKRSRCWFFPSM